MAKTFSYPSTRKTTLGARLRIRVLPFNVRTLPNYTITVTQAYNSNNTPGIILLRSNIEVFLTAETKLTLSGITIEIAEDVVIGTTVTSVSILDLEPNKTIPINSSTVTQALLLVYGCKNFNCNSEIQTIETTNVSHGVEKEEKQTFNSKKINFDITEIYNDVGGLHLLDLCENLTYRNYEFYFDYSYPDGSYKKGVALITSANNTSNMQSLRSFKIDAKIQPNTFSMFIVP